jgi:thiamine-phosphate pyrophosphorylase
MTDERGGDPVAIAQALPRRTGIIFRHHATPAKTRRRLFDRVRRIARMRGLIMLLAGPPMQARSWGADGAHHRSLLVSKGLRSVAVHNARELATARRIGADLIFASPVFASASHPGKRGMGVSQLGLMVGAQRARTIVLGGIDAKSFKKLGGMNVHGWAAIDAFKRVRI